MNKLTPIIILTLALVSCGKKTDKIKAVDGSSCSVVETANGALIKCEDGSEVEVSNGSDGQDGQDGANGVDGQAGLSAYELAVQLGFTGTLEEYLASLEGEDGRVRS